MIPHPVFGGRRGIVGQEGKVFIVVYVLISSLLPYNHNGKYTNSILTKLTIINPFVSKGYSILVLFDYLGYQEIL